MRVLTKVLCIIIDLNGFNMSDPGHHTIQILTNKAISYGLPEWYSLKNSPHIFKELKRENLATVISIS
jgi:hypothetical protein